MSYQRPLPLSLPLFLLSLPPLSPPVRTYFCLSGTPRIYTADYDPKNESLVEWKPVSSTLDDLHDLTDKFGKTRNKQEKALSKILSTELIPYFEEEQKVCQVYTGR